MKGHRRTSLFPTSCTCVGIPFHANPVFLASTSAIHCFLPSACCWVWKRWICSPRVTDVVQIRHFNSSSSWTPNWPWETGNIRGQSVANPYSAHGDCICLCVMGSWFRLRPLSPTVRQLLLLLALESDVDLLHLAVTNLTHTPSNTFCFVLPVLPPFTFFESHLSPSLGATPVLTEWFNGLLNSTTWRWLCRCWSIWASESHEPTREAGNKANSDTLNPPVI